MSDGIARTSTPDGAAGNPVDVTLVTTVAGSNLDRQRTQIGGAAGAELADVKNADPGPGSSLYGSIVRIAGRVPPAYCNTPPVVTRGNAGTAAAQVLATPLANRRRLKVRNLDPANDLEVAPATFAFGNGWVLHPGEAESFEWGPAVTVWLAASGASTPYALMEEAE